MDPDKDIIKSKDAQSVNPLISTEHSYDKALELAGNGKFQIGVLFVTGVSLMVVVTEGHCMAYVLPAAKCDLELSTSEQGFIYAVGYIGVVMASHFCGFIADTWGRRKALRTAMLTCFVASVISSFSVNSWMLIVTRFIVGVCLAGVKGTGITYLGEFQSNKNRPKFLSFLASFTSSAVFIQPILGLAIMTRRFEITLLGGFLYRPWRVYVLINSLVSGLAFIGLMLLPESPKFVLAMGQPTEALKILQKMYEVNRRKPKETYPVEKIAPLESSGTNLSEVHGVSDALKLIWNQTWPLFVRPHVVNMTLLCASQFAMFFVCHGAQMWYPQILTLYTENMDLPITTCQAISMGYSSSMNVTSKPVIAHIANSTADIPDPCSIVINPVTFKVTLVMGFSIFLFNTCLGLLMNRFGKKPLLTLWLTLNTIASLAIIWSNQFYLNSAFMIFVISTATTCTVLCGVFGDLFPTHLRAMALTVIIMFSRIGSVIGSNFVAAVIFKYCTSLYSLNFAMLFGSLCVSYYILRKCEILRSI